MTYQVDFTLPFRDRKEAGRLLAKRLQTYAQQSDVVVLVQAEKGL